MRGETRNSRGPPLFKNRRWLESSIRDVRVRRRAHVRTAVRADNRAGARGGGFVRTPPSSRIMNVALFTPSAWFARAVRFRPGAPSGVEISTVLRLQRETHEGSHFHELGRQNRRPPGPKVLRRAELGRIVRG